MQTISLSSVIIIIKSSLYFESTNRHDSCPKIKPLPRKGETIIPELKKKKRNPVKEKITNFKLRRAAKERIQEGLLPTCSSLLLLRRSPPLIHLKSNPKPNLNSSICTFFSINIRPLSLQAPIPLPIRRNPVFSVTPVVEPRSPQTLLADSTPTLSSLLSLALTASRFLHVRLLPQLGGSLSSTARPAFFSALKDRPSSYLNTPLTVVAAGLAMWLDIYSGVLMVRVLLSWFPNIPWERQPLSAIRDLCDPYLNLFRNIIPPIFDTLDELGKLASILNSSRGMY